MTTSRTPLHPFSADSLTARPDKINTSNEAVPVLKFDASTSQYAVWTFVAPQGLTAPLTLVLKCLMASATTGNIIMRGYVEAITAGDAVTPASASSFDSANSSSTTAVPGTLIEFDVSITLTNNDSIAAGDRVRIKVDRDAANASDTATGDLYLLVGEIRDAA